VKTLVHPADQGGCGHYRILWPAHALADQGHDVTVGDGHVPPDTDVVVVQRPLRRAYAERVIPLLQSRGIAVVVEVDDDFQTVDPRNPAWRDTHPRLSPDRNWQWLAKAAALADLVTVSTPALADRYGGHGRVVVLANYVPSSLLAVQVVPEERPVLGWTGSVATHPGDLDVAAQAVRQALAGRPGWRFRAVGGQQTLRALGLSADAGHETVPWTTDLTAYVEQYARLTGAIVPLAPGPFNEAKSWLKGLEAAAVGVPFVASASGPYRQLHDLGAGLLATTRGDWKRQLGRLLDDPALRTDVVAEGRRAAAGLTVEAHAWRWAEAWGQAVLNRRKTTRAAA
jgi:glycosyltransferase involved in cell wall biosynthesis